MTEGYSTGREKGSSKVTLRRETLQRPWPLDLGGVVCHWSWLLEEAVRTKMHRLTRKIARWGRSQAPGASIVECGQQLDEGSGEEALVGVPLGVPLAQSQLPFYIF